MPAPFVPSSANTSPSATVKSTPSTSIAFMPTPCLTWGFGRQRAHDRLRVTAVGRPYDTCHTATVRPVSALESLRRYSRLTLLSTTPLVGGIPLLFAIGEDAAVLSLIVVTVCAAPTRRVM